MARVEIDLSSAFSAEATKRRKKRIAAVLLSQTLQRIEDGGDDEVRFAPLDFSRPGGGSGVPLYDTGANLYQSIASGYDDRSVWVGSNFEGASVLQLGTEGKGGELPTIKPVKARGLFIPLSRAASKAVLVGEGSAKRRSPAVRKEGKKTFRGLERGKDFMFVGKVDINPRPFLRISKGNLEEITEVWEE